MKQLIRILIFRSRSIELGRIFEYECLIISLKNPQNLHCKLIKRSCATALKENLTWLIMRVRILETMFNYAYVNSCGLLGARRKRLNIQIFIFKHDVNGDLSISQFFSC